MNIDLQLAPELRMQPSAAMVAYAQVLMLSSAELEEHLEREVASNPALERLEPAPLCPRCGVGFRNGRCPACWRTTALGGGGPTPLAPRADHDVRAFDPPAPTADARLELTLVVSARHRAVTEYLLDEVDERGFLDIEVDEVARALRVPGSVVEGALVELQHAGPAGFASRNGRECLLTQLDRLDETGEVPDLVRQVVERHLDALASADLTGIAEATRADVGQVSAARAFIVEHLRPHAPLDEVSTAGPPWASAVVPAWPDVAIQADGSGDYEVEVVERQRTLVGVDPLYRDIALGGVAGMSQDDQQQIAALVARARCLLDRLEERWSTMQAVAEHAALHQRDFLRRGSRHLRALTRRQVAEEIGVHESTVSRATRLKLVRLPNGRLVPFATFFPRSPGVREALAELVEEEPRPLSDGELADRLADAGYTVARRTVAKYRAELGIRSVAGR